MDERNLGMQTYAINGQLCTKEIYDSWMKAQSDAAEALHKLMEAEQERDYLRAEIDMLLTSKEQMRNQLRAADDLNEACQPKVGGTIAEWIATIAMASGEYDRARGGE